MADQPAASRQSGLVLVKQGCDSLIRLASTSAIVVLFQSLTSMLLIKECQWQDSLSIISDPVWDPVMLDSLKSY